MKMHAILDMREEVELAIEGAAPEPRGE